MKTPTLPACKYNPNYANNGSFVTANAKCDCCKEFSELIYAGPVYAEDDNLKLCPGCIISGNAFEEFEAEFNLSDNQEIARRTPGWPAWNDIDWATSEDGDPMIFVGPVNARDRKANAEVRGLLDSEGVAQDDSSVVVLEWRHPKTGKSQYTLDFE